MAELVSERGPAGLSMREAARRARVSHGAPAHHFGNKTGMLTAFATQGFERLVARCRATLADGDDTGRAALAAIGRGYIRFALADPARFTVMFRADLLDEADPDLEAASGAAYGLLHDAIARCVAEGAIRARDAATITAAAWSMVHGFAALWLGGRMAARLPPASRDPHALADAITAAFVDAVARG